MNVSDKPVARLDDANRGEPCRLRSCRSTVLMLVALSLSVLSAVAQTAAPGATTLYREGSDLLLEGDPYRAADLFAAAVRVNPYYADAWAALARCQYELGEYEMAMSHIDTALRYGPRSSSLLTLRAFAAIGLGRIDDARSLFEETLKSMPNDRDARFGLALLDIRSGRPSEARARLAASLRSAPGDARALLSLALIARAEGREAESVAWLDEALRRSGNDPDILFAAATIYADNGDVLESARLAKAALDIRPAHAEALLLLATLYAGSGQLADARTTLEAVLAGNRAEARAWFLLGSVEADAGRLEEAVRAWSSLVALRPDDEMARLALENLVMDRTGFEAAVRSDLAAWRFRRAADFEKRLLYQKAQAEYRRGLAIDPYSARGRARYAELLRMSGLKTSYLAELRFLAGLGKDDRAIKDAIEIYSSLLDGSVPGNWNVDGTALEGVPYRLTVYATGGRKDSFHPGSNFIMAKYIRDLLAMEPGLAPRKDTPGVESFADAFRLSRESGDEWFVLVSVAETDRDVVVSAELRTARTGELAFRIEVPRSGNDRVTAASAYLVAAVQDALPLRGVVIDRNASRVLIDLGAVDGIRKGDNLLVVRNNKITIKPDGSGLEWNDGDAVASLVVDTVDDEVSEATMKRLGFFDRLNPGDIVVRPPSDAPATDTAGTQQRPAPDAPAGNGTPGTASGTAPAGNGKPVAGTAATPVASFVWSTLFDRVRSLY